MYSLIIWILMGILFFPISLAFGMLFVITLGVSYFVVEVCGYGKHKDNQK